MRAHYCWREVTSVAEFLESSNSSAPFELPGVAPNHMPDRPILIRHLHLEAAIDPAVDSVQAVATLTVVTVQDDVDRLVFDCRDLDIESVWVQGTPDPVPFDHDGVHLSVMLPAPVARAATVTAVVKYSVHQPAMGLYFIGPNEAHPDRPAHVWSQNQDDDAPFWVPCIEDPGVKFTTSVGLTVPEGLTALSNGVLAGEPSTAEGRTTWRWEQSAPIPVYLLAVVVGPFVETVDEGEGTDVVWYSLPGCEDDARRAFGRTRDMIDFFEEYLGVRYPYPRYAQVAVSEFVFGGMENATLTVITDRALPDERAYPEYKTDGLVAHELAHQWFGDLVTCREWAHAWLNEGFATYLDVLFREHDMGPDERDYELLRLARGYYAEAGRYHRPLVMRAYEAPLDVFDRHLYHKGAWVLHMLRNRLGDGAFRRALRIYLTRFAHNQAETHDLRRAIEDATGVRLTAFFDRWVWDSGHPTVRWRYRTHGKDITVSATAGDDWSLDLPVMAVTGDGVQRATLRLRGGRGEVTVPGAAGADAVCVDPDYTVLGRFVPQLSPVQLDRLASAGDVSVSRRVDALAALGKKRTAAATRKLMAHLNNEEAFWGIRVEAARALGQDGSEAAVDALCTRALEEPHPKARRAIVDALATCRGSRAAGATVLDLLRSGDPSLFVESSAARAVGRLRPDGAREVLTEALERSSFNDMVEVAAMAGLGRLGDATVLDCLVERTQHDRTTLVRAGAIRALAELGRMVPETRARIWEVFDALLSAPAQQLRFALVGAAERLELPESLGFLGRLAEFEHDGLLRRRARDAARALTRRQSKNADRTGLRDSVDALTERHRRLAARIDRLHPG